MSSLIGKVVFITGGAGAFGKAFSAKFLKSGYKVCLGDVNSEEGKSCEEKLSSEYGKENIKYVLCDVTSDESFKEAFSECKKKFGRIDILVNNAGIGNEKNLSAVININLLGTIRGTELALEHMGKDKGHEGGRVINVASIAGLKDLPFGPYYSTSKSGIIHYTRVIGHPFHFNYTGVIVQCLCPSLVKTPFIQLAPNATYNAQCDAAIRSLFGKIPLLEVSEVAEALFTLLEDTKPGAVMVLEKEKAPYFVPPAVS